MTESALRDRPTLADARLAGRLIDRCSLIGRSPAMARLRDIVARVAPSLAPVIVTGPSGSGKEAVARAIHAGSNRAAKPFIAINCGAIAPDLIESELFGHEKGAFTGASCRRVGRFEEADGGTLFLDEIGDMRPDMQVKLLRVLEDGLVHRVGGGRPVPVNVRIVSATHRNVLAEVDAGHFREDLYFRLGVLIVRTPSLAEHAGDISELIAHFQKTMGCEGQVRFDASALARLERHDWPGNVRELRNVIERAGVLFAGSSLSAAGVDHLLGNEPVADVCIPARPISALATPVDSAVPMINLKGLMEALERQHIASALKAADGVVAEAARLLTLKRTTLIEKMRKYGLIDCEADDAKAQTPKFVALGPAHRKGPALRKRDDRQARATLNTACNSYVTSAASLACSAFSQNVYVVQSIGFGAML